MVVCSWFVYSFIVFILASLVAQRVTNLPIMQETLVQSLGLGRPLEKEMATHSSILAWKIHRVTQELDMTEQLNNSTYGHRIVTNFLFFFLAVPSGMQDLSSLTRN